MTVTRSHAGSNKIVGPIGLEFNLELNLANSLQLGTLSTSYTGLSRVTLVLSSAVGATALTAFTDRIRIRDNSHLRRELE